MISKMKLQQISRILKDSGFIVKAKRDKIANFEFLAVSLAYDDVENMIPDSAFMIYIENNIYIVEVGVAGILILHPNPTVISQTVLSYHNISRQDLDYPLYRAIWDIKKIGYIPIIEDDTIYIYQSRFMKNVIQSYEIDREIKSIQKFDKQSSDMLIKYEDEKWTYSGSSIEKRGLTLQEAVEIVKNRRNTDKA